MQKVKWHEGDFPQEGFLINFVYDHDERRVVGVVMTTMGFSKVAHWRLQPA